MERRYLIATFFGLVAALFLWLFLSQQFSFATNGFGIISNLDGTIIVNDGDISGYNATFHEFILTTECAERIKKSKGYLEGPFTINVGGEEVLNGIFVPSIISRSYPSSQLVIIYPSFDSNYGVMKLQMGYPWDEPVNPDPRDESKITKYFESTGRLIR